MNSEQLMYFSSVSSSLGITLLATLLCMVLFQLLLDLLYSSFTKQIYDYPILVAFFAIIYSNVVFVLIGQILGLLGVILLVAYILLSSPGVISKKVMIIRV